jgi:hypothetical protein
MDQDALEPALQVRKHRIDTEGKQFHGEFVTLSDTHSSVLNAGPLHIIYNNYRIVVLI